MKRNVNVDESQDDRLAEIEIDKTDQNIIILVSFLAFVFAILGFSMSDVFSLLIRP